MKNTRYSILSLVFLILAMPGCAWFGKKPQAAEPTLRLVDANTEKIYKDAHIPGAVHVDLGRIEEAAAGWNKETPVVIYCSDYTCTSSHMVAKQLKELGFNDIAVYAGGINEWYQRSKENKEKYPVEGEAQHELLQKEVTQTVSTEGDVHIITAEELSKKLEESRK